MHLNYPATAPLPRSMEKLCSVKPVSGAKKAGNCCSKYYLPGYSGNMGTIEKTHFNLFQSKNGHNIYIVFKLFNSLTVNSSFKITIQEDNDHEVAKYF